MLTSTALDCGRGSWLIPHFPVASTVISHGAGVIAPYRSDHTLRAPNIPIGRRLLQTSGRVPREEVAGAGRSVRASVPTSVRMRGVPSARSPSGTRRSPVSRHRIEPPPPGAAAPWPGVRATATPLTGGGPSSSPGDTQRRAHPRAAGPGQEHPRGPAASGSASADTRATAVAERGVVWGRLPPSARFTPMSHVAGAPPHPPTALLLRKLTGK